MTNKVRAVFNRTYITEAYKLELIKESPYDRFVDKRGESAERQHLTKEQIAKLLQLRKKCKTPEDCKYIDFFMFQTSTGMIYSDARAFNYNEHVVKVNGELFIDGERIKTGFKFFTPVLPVTMEILRRNNFKMDIISNQKYNSFLKGHVDASIINVFFLQL